MNKPYKIGKSNIEGLGLIAATDLKPGDLIGLSHSNGEIASEIGQYYNHSDTPNAVSELVGSDRYVIASDNISMGGEITLDYRRQPELEQPEDFINPKRMQGGGEEKKMFDWKGYFSGEQGIIPDLYGKTTKESYMENKDAIQTGADVVTASGLPIISQVANVVSTGIDYGDAAMAYAQGDYDTAKKELAKGTTGFALGFLPGGKAIKAATKGVGESIVKGGINTGVKYGAKSGIKSGVQDAVDTIVDTNTQKKNVGDVVESPDSNTMAMMGGEVYRYERSPFKDGKFVISNPADLIIEMTKTEIFTPEFKMGGTVTADEFTLEKKFDNKRELPYVQYVGEPDIEGRVYYDDVTNEIVDVTTLELKKKRRHNRIKTIIDKYEQQMDLSKTELDVLNSLGLLD